MTQGMGVTATVTVAQRRSPPGTHGVDVPAGLDETATVRVRDGVVEGGSVAVAVRVTVRVAVRVGVSVRVGVVV